MNADQILYFLTPRHCLGLFSAISLIRVHPACFYSQAHVHPRPIWFRFVRLRFYPLYFLATLRRCVFALFILRLFYHGVYCSRHAMTDVKEPTHERSGSPLH